MLAAVCYARQLPHSIGSRRAIRLPRCALLQRLPILLALGLALLSACTAPSQQDEPTTNNTSADVAPDFEDEDAQEDATLDDVQVDTSLDVPQDPFNNDEPDVTVACTPAEDLIQSISGGLIDCGSMIDHGESCFMEETSCFLEAAKTCSPAQVIYMSDGGIDGRPWLWTFVMDGSKEGTDCVVTYFLDRRSDDTEGAEAATLTMTKALISETGTTADGCGFMTHDASDPQELGSCADVFASCPICQW